MSSNRDKWLVVALLFFVGLINYADRTSITAVYALLKTDLGFSDIGLGAIGSLFLWSYAVASPFAGHLADRGGRAPLLVWGLAAWSAITLLTGLVTAKWQLLSMRVVLGIVESIYIPAAMALVAEYHRQNTRAKAMTLLSVGQYLGLVVGGTVAGFLGERYGWRSPLCVLGVVGLLLAVLCFAILPRGTERRVETKRCKPIGDDSFMKTMLELVHIPSFLILASAGVLTAIGVWIFINWLPLYFKETLGMTLASAGFWGSSLVSITGIAGQLAGAPISDVLARKGMHRRMLMQAVLILCAAPTLLVFLYTKKQALIMSAFVLYSVFRNAADLNIIPLVCDLAGRSRMSTAIGVTNMLNTLAGGLAILAAGFLKSGIGLALVFATTAGILLTDGMLLSIGYLLFIRKDLANSATA